ncbi:hypothetical protein [Mesorhizobium sp.]|uniref:hypothetical protein n=1 Tax=Mesorhizobium sp. TaxID=1871066 RepID=UPI00257C672F|nr:hypothetical protein [Mesorhizobium sp.]
MTANAPTYNNYRYPTEIVARTVWLFRFNPSLRGVRGNAARPRIVVSYKAIRRWR